MTATLLADLPPLGPVRPLPDPPTGPLPGPCITQLVVCPYCGKPVAGLLSGCTEPACWRLELDDDRALERTQDL